MPTVLCSSRSPQGIKKLATRTQLVRMLAKGESSLPLSSIVAATLLAERALCASAIRCDLKTQKKEICWERRSYFRLEVTKKSICDHSRLTNRGPLLFAETPLATFLSSLDRNQEGLCEAL